MVRVSSRWWNEPRPAPSNSSPSRWEFAAAGVVLVLAVVEVLVRDDLGWAGLVIGLALSVCVALCRRHPLAAVALGFGTLAVVDLVARVAGAAPVTLYVAFVIVVVLHAVTRWGSGREMLVGGGVVIGCFVVIAAVDGSSPEEWVGGAAVLLAVAAIGLVGRARSQARIALVERVRAEEREHLARELHDTVAHHVSAIAVQAQAGRMLLNTEASGGAADALDLIGSEASRTLSEMRGMVDVLRGAGHRQHRLADLDELVTSPGGPVPVSLQAVEVPELSPSVESAVFRVAQEAVTNAQRHARRASVIEVVVTADPTSLHLSVHDDGAPPAPARSGYGLTGMRERVALLGGTLAAGPDEGGGWLVRASLPRGGPRR